MFTSYERDNREVAVRQDLKGRQDEFDLCEQCQRGVNHAKFSRCPIREGARTSCRNFKIMVVVWECPYFQELD